MSSLKCLEMQWVRLMVEKVLVTTLNREKAIEAVLPSGERVYIELLRTGVKNAHIMIKAVKEIKINKVGTEKKEYYENKYKNSRKERH